MTDSGALVLWGIAVTAFNQAVREFLRTLRERGAQANKANAALDLAARKAELTSHADLLRHSMERKLLTAEFRLRKLHRVYPRLSKAFHLAVGSGISLFGGRVVKTFSNATREQFVQAVDAENIPNEQKAEIIEAFDRNRSSGVNRLHQLTRRIEVENAREQRQKPITS